MSDTNLLPFLLSIQGKKITALLMADGSRGMGGACHAARPSEAPARDPEQLTRIPHPLDRFDGRLTNQLLGRGMRDTTLQPPSHPGATPTIDYTQRQTIAADQYQSSPRTPDDGSAPDGKTLFEIAVEMVEYYKGWIDWDNPSDIIKKPVFFAMRLLRISNFDELIPGIIKYFEKCWRRDYNEYNKPEFYRCYNELRSSTIHDLSEFIKQSEIDLETIRQGRERYYQTQYALYLVDFLLFHRPCCRLFYIAWLIPAIAAGIPAIPLIAYAAEQLANFINDPIEPLQHRCTSIGNSWLHRLGIYLLHQCNAQSIPPDLRLIRLMSLVSLPPSSSVKSGKATRSSDYLAYGKDRCYLHEASPALATGTVLALELLGEFDANRQEEHFRRVELAVAFYAHSVLNGEKLSVKSLQQESGLSWSDANKLVKRPFFSKLVFEYQCRYFLYEPVARSCPACAAIR